MQLFTKTIELLVWGLISINAIEGYNISNRPTLSKQEDRYRKESPPEILKIRHYHRNRVELIVLRRVPDSTLEPNFLPIMEIDVEIGENPKYILNGIKPVFYHGVSSYSAITFFPHANTLHGVIDHRFYVEDLPMNDANNPDRVTDFIHPISGSLSGRYPDRVTNFIHPISGSLSGSTEESGSNPNRDPTHNKRKLQPDVDPIPRKRLKEDSKHTVKKILYPEILLAADVEFRISDMGSGKYKNVIMYILAYQNAVDMLLRRLKRIDVRISIAAIVLGETSEFVDLVMGDMESLFVDPELFVPMEDALNRLGNYFYDHPKFKRESFDFVIWMTRSKLMKEGSPQQVVRSGVGAPPVQCGGLHHDEKFTEIISNRAVVSHDDRYADYQLVARELAHLMFVPDDDVEISHEGQQFSCLLPYPSSQTSGIMDRVSRSIDGCLAWSHCSEIHFERYANSISSCCLLNFPYRTMKKSSPPIQLLTEAEQCQCYGMRPNHQPSQMRDCRDPLECMNDDQNVEIVAVPLDGTRCLENSNEHICIDDVCV